MPNSRAGFVLLDSYLNPIAANTEALRILAFPTDPAHIQSVDHFLQEKVRSSLTLPHRSPSASSVVTEYRSGNRRYCCTALLLERQRKPGAHPAVVLLLERNLGSFVDIDHACDQFDLTPRERETVEYLMQGLTTKEIAERMKVSPSTVNAFVRLVTIKVGASGRSGVVGKIVRPNTGWWSETSVPFAD